MKQNIDCPFCDTEFEVESWDVGECPTCGEEYYWSEDCAEDYSDCWDSVYWVRHDELLRKYWNEK